MQVFGNILQESENREAIYIRHDADPLLEQWQQYLNTEMHQCIIVKKNASIFVFVIMSSRVMLELSLMYDDERFWFETVGCRQLNALSESTVDIEKVDHKDGKYAFAIKVKDWKYKNFACISYTSQLYEQLESLASYDYVIEELHRKKEMERRRQEEDDSAGKQLNVWTQYIKKERELLDEANKPFALSTSLPEIKKTYVDVETLPHIKTNADESDLMDISEIIGGKVKGTKLEMTLSEFRNWFDAEENKSRPKFQALFPCTSLLNVMVFGT